MTKSETEKWGKLVAKAEAHLADPLRQSFDVWRGDMRAILAAAKELKKHGK